MDSEKFNVANRNKELYFKIPGTEKFKYGNSVVTKLRHSFVSSFNNNLSSTHCAAGANQGTWIPYKPLFPAILYASKDKKKQ